MVTLPLVSRVVKTISRGRRIKYLSRWHWGPEAPQAGGEEVWGPGSRAPSRLQGQHPVGVPRGEGPRSKTDLRF